jgi:tetratricopeptide (TPR) repeat protein
MCAKNKKTNVTPPVKTASSLMPDSFSWHGWIVFALGALVYFNTLNHDFTQDDAIVIYDNMFTTQGIKGLKGLFTKDTFFGFFKTEGKDKLVSGGRYRPLTPAMFALEYELFGKSPFTGHLINVILYGFLCFVIYHTLALIWCHKEDTAEKRWMVLAVAVIYALHPLHTEAVANIKGRDEIMAMLGSMGALYYAVRYVDSPQMKYLLFSAFALFLGLLSKENTITFLAIVPLAVYFFRPGVKFSVNNYGLYLGIPAVLFLLIRGAVLGNDFGGAPMELMNNPYLKWVNNTYVPFTAGEKLATIVYTLGKYIQLLIFPHPLTHDYYPRHIGIMHFGDFGVILSLITYAVLAVIGIRALKTRSIPGFGVLFFLITLSIVSNLVFPIGTNMSERFMFMPSLGFAIVLGWLLTEYLLKRIGQQAFIGLLALLSLAYCYKTLTRNTVWKDDFTLFTTDVKTSANSAKVLNAAGGALTTAAFDVKDETKKQSMLKEAIGYLIHALEIHPTYKNAYLIKGNAHYYLREFDAAIQSYDAALRIDPDFNDAATNMAVTLRDAGRRAGEVENNLEKAEQYLTRSLSLNPNDAETLRLLGVANGIKGNHTAAVSYFEKVVQLLPDHAPSYLNLSNAYRNTGDNANAEKYLAKARELDPNIGLSQQQ